MVIAGAAIAAAAAFAAFVLLWHFVFDDAPWSIPPPPDWSGRWTAFSVYPWAEIALVLLFAAAILPATFFVLVGERRKAYAIGFVAFFALVLLGSLAVYLPFFGFSTPRIDRVRGRVEEPLRAFRLLGAAFVITIAAHALFVVVAAARHTPNLTRRVAFGAAAVTCALYLHLCWLCLVFPAVDGWHPAEWDRPHLLLAVRPCRGATLVDRKSNGAGTFAYPVGRIDDLWLAFRDPRSGGKPVPAISFSRSGREGYVWLTLPEAARLRIRIDDPAVIDCDSRWRRELVSPASWHKVGEW